VCFGVDDLDAAVAELAAHHVEIVRGEQHHPGRVIQQVFFVDPAGNTIELQEDRDA
jgi:catechol 2,3-dioxygenase-like lactoylglutathione lyase family enzyme